jgi:subtilisin
MASKKKDTAANLSASCATERLLLAAMERGDDSLETGRFLITYREGAATEGIAGLKAHGLKIADTRDFADQAMAVEDVGDADVVAFAELGVALVGGESAAAQGLTAGAQSEGDGPIEAVEPEYFVFAAGSDYLRGFQSATAAIARDLGGDTALLDPDEEDVDAEVLGATWGLRACKVPTSPRTGVGIRVAVLDTGFDLGHPDFAGRVAASRSFVGQPVQDLHGHGTHCTGTAAGPRSPRGTTPRYGIGYGARIYIGKVLTNAGSGSTATVLAGMNWAIANRCQVISMSLGAQTGVQAAYTAAGAAALRHGCLIIAAAGNSNASTGAPANSPTIMSVASLDPNLRKSSFSNHGKIEIAAPGRDVFSAAPRPRLYQTMSGTSMATPHVAGCAALWAQTNASLRGMALWRHLQARARRLALPAAQVGAGLVQAPQ